MGSWVVEVRESGQRGRKYPQPPVTTIPKHTIPYKMWPLVPAIPNHTIPNMALGAGHTIPYHRKCGVQQGKGCCYGVTYINNIVLTID